MSTVPCGAWVAARQSPTLASLRVKSPTAWLRVSGETHCTLTQGLGVDGGRVNGQPAMTKVSEARTSGEPPALARVFDVMALTVPPCGHIRTLAVFNRPPITSPPMRLLMLTSESLTCTVCDPRVRVIPL